MRRTARLFCLLLLALSAFGEQYWKAQPLPAEKGSRWLILDFKLLSPARAVAVGCLSRGKSCESTALVTADGGVSWRMVKTPATGQSLHFVSETTGWMLAGGGLYRSRDSGLSWERLPNREAIASAVKVHFASETKGWMVGRHKAVYATTDGGATWTPVAAAAAVKTSPDFTSFNWISFADDRLGMIAGASVPPRPGDTGRPRELPHLTIFLDTRDGGDTWNASTTSMFGSVARVAFAPDGRGLGLVEFLPGFEFPSEVFRIDWKSGQSSRVFRRADCAVTDITFDESGYAYLAAVGVPVLGKQGRVKMFRSRDLAVWEEFPMPRRAVARKVILAVSGRNVWAVTGDGTLLRLASR